MKKFHTHDRCNQENPKINERPRHRSEETRKSSTYDSLRHGKDYFGDENESVRHHNHSHMVDRRYQGNPHASITTQRDQVYQNYELRKNRSGDNSTNEQRCLNEANKRTELFNSEEHYRKGVHPLCPNTGSAYCHSRNQSLTDAFPKAIDTEMKSRTDAEAGCFNARRDSNKTNEENASKNLDVKNIYIENENGLSSLPKYNTPSYESNQLPQYYNKQNNDQSRAYFHDLSKNSIHTYDENVKLHSNPNITVDNLERAAFLSNSASYEGMGFHMLKLTDLIYYNANLMQEQKLSEYASAVKYKILDKIDKFVNPEREELEFLCEITDGDQSEKNQRIITTRKCRIVKNIIEKYPPFLHSLETAPPPQVIVYRSVPNLHDIPNGHCGNYQSPVLEIAQNSEVLLTPATNYNLRPNCNIAQNGVVSKENSINSYDTRSFNNCIDNSEVLKFNKNKSPALNSEENGHAVEESSKQQFPRRKTLVECVKMSSFHSFGLDDLLRFDHNEMHGDMVFDFAFSLKQRILANIDRFEDLIKEKLQFLCELTDGTQLEENQKLINERMCDVITCCYVEDETDEDNQYFVDEQPNYLQPRERRYPDARRR